MPTDPSLQLEPVPPRIRRWLFALVVVAPLLLLVVAALATRDPAAGETLVVHLYALFGTAAFCLALCWLFDRLLQRHHLSLGDAGLEIVTTFYRRRLALAELDLAHARPIDLDERPEYRPLLKTNGMALPGFQSGWFRMRNGGKAFVARVGGQRVLRIPTARGFDLILQARQPQALLERLRTLADARPRG